MWLILVRDVSNEKLVYSVEIIFWEAWGKKTTRNMYLVALGVGKIEYGYFILLRSGTQHLDKV